MIEYGPSEPRGKALMRSGAEKLLYGIAFTVDKEIHYALGAGFVGGLVGIPMGLIDGDVVKGIKDYAKGGAMLGALWGWNTAHLEFNQDAPNTMKPVRWYDWLGAVIIASHIVSRERPPHAASRAESVLWSQLFNPISTSAMKDIARGGAQAMFG